MTSIAFEKFRDQLTAHGSAMKDSRQGHFLALCPAHEDKNPSLSVDDKEDRVMIYCHAGCHADDVVASIGLELADLFDGEPDKDRAVPVRSYVYQRPDGSPWVIKDRYYPKTFVQRLPGTLPGDRSGLKGREPLLYHVPKVAQGMAAGHPVFLVEGERDVETCERHGLVATCTPGGAGSLWKPRWSDFLKAASEVVIVADQDLMKPDGSLGSGQQHAQTARAGLRSVGVKVRTVAPAVGKDATDHFTAGYGVNDFVPEPTAFTRPRGMTAPVLMSQEFKPLVYAVEGLLPSGLAILAGAPKCGKSWAVLSIGLAVAAGGPALSVLPTSQGSVLYLAREDGYRRLQSRIRLLMGGTAAPKGMELVSSEQDWPGGEQGLANMTEWAEEVRNPRLVVIDTLARVEPDLGENVRAGAYAGNYSMMNRYKQWADVHDCTVLLVHHDNKTKVEAGSDPFSRINGTRAITGGADTMLFLESQRGTGQGLLHLTGRDVSEQTLDLYRSGPMWNSMTEAD